MSNLFELQNGIFLAFRQSGNSSKRTRCLSSPTRERHFFKNSIIFWWAFFSMLCYVTLGPAFYTFLLQRLSMSSCKPSYTKMAFKHNTIFSRLIVPYYYVALKVLLKWNTNYQVAGQWLWLSWLSGRFRHQRSAVQIQSLALFYMEHLFTVNCVEKTKIKKKRPGMAHF